MKTQNTVSSVTAGKPATPRGNGKAKSSSAATSPSPGSTSAELTAFDSFLTHLINFFTSLRLTVACLALGLILVFWGTLAQVELGLFKAQNEFFRSFFIYWKPSGTGLKIPIFPGGYLLGGVLVINLVASHFKRFKLSKDKAGIWMVHIGLILLLLGQLGTDMLSRESALHLREGEAKNYSEADRQAELAIIDTSEPDVNKVVAIPQPTLMRKSEIQHPELPFGIRVKHFYVNSLVESRPQDATGPPPATQGVGLQAVVSELPHVTEMNKRDVPSAVIEIVASGSSMPESSLGTWLVSEFISGQSFAWNKHTYELVMRPRRFYKPYSIQLVQFRHDVYPGTETPKNFSSRVVLQRPETGENREILIYMNSPLRYAGETYYQASFDEDNHGTILQVVHNPSWLTPYFSCVLVGLGLVVQFAVHLLGFTLKKKTV